MDPQMDGLLNEIPTKMDDNWGYPYDLGNLHMSIWHGQYYFVTHRRTWVASGHIGTHTWREKKSPREGLPGVWVN